MKIFGISLMTIIIVIVAYWAGSKGLLGDLKSKVAG